MAATAFSADSLAVWDGLDHYKFRDEREAVAANLKRIPLDAGERQAVELEERSLAENHGREKILEGRLVGVLRERGVGGECDDNEKDREAHPIPTRLGRGAASRRVIGH